MALTRGERLAPSYLVDYGIAANVLPFMTGSTLIWFNSCQPWAPSRCLFFSAHLDRFGPDNAQLLEIFLDISHQWGSGGPLSKIPFPRNRFLWRTAALMWHICWLTRDTYSMNIQLILKYATHFVLSDTVPRLAARRPSLSSRSWNYSFPPRQGWTFRPHAGGGHRQVRDVDGFHAGEEPGGFQRTWTNGQKLGDRWRLHPWASLHPQLLRCFNTVAYSGSTGSGSFSSAQTFSCFCFFVHLAKFQCSWKRSSQTGSRAAQAAEFHPLISLQKFSLLNALLIPDTLPQLSKRGAETRQLAAVETNHVWFQIAGC